MKGCGNSRLGQLTQVLQALNSGSEKILKESISQELAEAYRTIPKNKNPSSVTGTCIAN